MIDSGVNASGRGGDDGFSWRASTRRADSRGRFFLSVIGLHVSNVSRMNRTIVAWPRSAARRLCAAPRSPPSARVLVSSKLGSDLSCSAAFWNRAIGGEGPPVPALPLLSMALGTYFLWMSGLLKWLVMDILWILWTIPAVIAVEGKPVLPSSRARDASSCRYEFETKRVWAVHPR